MSKDKLRVSSTIKQQLTWAELHLMLEITTQMGLPGSKW